MNAQDDPDITGKWSRWTNEEKAKFCDRKADAYPVDHPQRAAILAQAAELRKV